MSFIHGLCRLDVGFCSFVIFQYECITSLTKFNLSKPNKTECKPAIAYKNLQCPTKANMKTYENVCSM